MIKIHPQYIKDMAGNNMIVLQQNEFDQLIKLLDELEDIQLYDEAVSNDDGERIPMEEAFQIIETQRENS